jgi:hypothetical protein
LEELCANYFETDKTVDATRVAIQGHSRYGKAALVTMALDERFATGYISSSGAGGAQLHRRTFRRSTRRSSTATSVSASTPGGHTAEPTWPTFLTFAARYFDVPGRRTSSAR